MHTRRSLGRSMCGGVGARSAFGRSSELGAEPRDDLERHPRAGLLQHFDGGGVLDALQTVAVHCQQPVAAPATHQTQIIYRESANNNNMVRVVSCMVKAQPETKRNEMTKGSRSKMLPVASCALTLQPVALHNAILRRNARMEEKDAGH